MDGLMLLAEARAAGLRVEASGAQLVIRGPRQAEPIARRLLAHKPVILGILAYRATLRQLYALNAQAADADHAAIAAALDEQARLLDELGPALAERIGAEEAELWRLQHDRCAFCGGRCWVHTPDKEARA